MSRATSLYSSNKRTARYRMILVPVLLLIGCHYRYGMYLDPRVWHSLNLSEFKGPSAESPCQASHPPRLVASHVYPGGGEKWRNNTVD